MMPDQDLLSSRGALVQRYYEPIYRLALLIATNERAAEKLVENAYRNLLVETGDPEAALICSLLPRRAARRWRRQAGQEEAARATLDVASANHILDVLAQHEPAARLVIGLHYLRGLNADEIAALLNDPRVPAPAETLAQFRCAVARALDRIPEEADDALMIRLDTWLDGRLTEDEELQMRRMILFDPAAHAQRDGLIEVRELLPRAIPALLAAVPAPDFAARLHALVEQQPAHRAPHPRRGARWGLTLGVFALAAIIIIGPSLRRQHDQVGAASAPPAAEILDAAAHRFDHAPLQAGVLHERYRMQIGDQPAYLVERWYDYAAPHRLAATIQIEGRKGPPVAAVSSDGRSLIQYRYGSANGDDELSIDVRVTPGEAEAMLPALRGLLASEFFLWDLPDGHGDIGPLYLSQAREKAATSLGKTTFLGRPALLLTYRTEQLPTPPPGASTPNQRPVQVLLTIDAQTYALLEVTILPDGAEAAEARHPLQADLFEVVGRVADTPFKLPDTEDVIQRHGLLSVILPRLPADSYITLADARRTAANPLLAPRQLPDPAMRGLALALHGEQRDGPQDAALLYEGEFQTVLLLPEGFLGGPPSMGEEQSAGDYRYRKLKDLSRFEQNVGALAAVVYRADAPDQRLVALLSDAYATSAEREAMLAQMIASLTPVTPQNISAFQRQFRTPAAARE